MPNETMLKRFASALAVITAVASLHAPTAATVSHTKARVETLASDEFEGRLAGSAGERLAADYLTRALMRLGAKPLPGRTDFFQPFDFTAGTKDAGSSLAVLKKDAARMFITREHVQALSFSDSS
ncbi:MAG TPA: hypothetical protein VEK56_11990, partial [Vicinamibacterales bacterium]|nr:hypothetical protein [Vicinamibacterales bacterium]